MWRYWRPIKFKGGYIIGKDRRDFYNICIREPRLSTYHRMILVGIMGVYRAEEPQIPNREGLLVNCGPEEVPNSRVRHDLLRPLKRGQETNVLFVGEGNMYFRGNLESDRAEYNPKAEKPCGKEITPYGI